MQVPRARSVTPVPDTLQAVDVVEKATTRPEAAVAESDSGTHLDMVLQLFCGMLKFHDGCLNHLSDLYGSIKRGKLMPKLETQETDLYLNPRRVR